MLGQFNGGNLLCHLDGNANDSSGNGNNGTATNVTRIGGKIGTGAGYFNGSSSKINLPENAGFNFTTNFTIGAIIQASAHTRSIVTNYSQFGSGTPIAGYQFVLSNTWKLRMIIGTGGAYSPGVSIFILDGATDLSDGGIHVVRTTYDGFTLKLYVDGKLDGSLSVSITLGYNASVRANIGCNEYAPGTIIDYWYGMIDEVILEGRAWSLAQIKKDYTFTKSRFGIL